MDEGCPLTAAPPDLERGAAPLGPPAPAQPTAVPVPGCTHLEGGLFSAPGCLWAVALAAVPGRLLLPAGRQPHRLQAPFSLGVVPHPLLLRALGPWPPPPPAPAPPAGAPSRPCLPPLGLLPALSPSCLLSLSVCPVPPSAAAPGQGGTPKPETAWAACWVWSLPRAGPGLWPYWRAGVCLLGLQKMRLMSHV